MFNYHLNKRQWTCDPAYRNAYILEKVFKHHGKISVKNGGNDVMTDSIKEGVVCLKPEDFELLARLEEQNRLLESDAKSLNSISGTSGSGQSCHSNHSRKGSDTSSQLSIVSATSAAADGEDSEDLWVIWGRIINDWDMYFKKKTSYVKELVRKGIPQHFRGIVWQLLCSAYNSPIRDLFAEYMKSTSPCEKVIHRDIARTYPDHEFFKEKDGMGQESLFNVMKAYSLHDREVGYCQGSGFIVGLLLMMMPEEEAFAVVVKLMQEYRLRELFKPSMAELGLCMYQLECLVQELVPELHMHFQSQSFHTSMYASSWFLTLFTTSLPLNVACRVMDVFISEGMEIIFKIGIGILQASKDSLISLDMEGMLKYFQKDVPAMFENDPDTLMNIAYQVKYNSKKMKKIAKEYNAMKSKEKEEMIELRRLRTENRLLRQRIENLEQESSALADRLIQGQVIRAQEAEENFSIKRELAIVKQQNNEIMQKLEEAKQSLQHHQEKEANNAATALSQAEDMIQMLQQELMSVRLREAESSCTMKELKERIQELEESNKKMREMQPDNSVAHLQEELIAVKLREAEANLSMKELRQKVNELEIHWQKHLARISASGTPSKKKDFNKMNVAQLQDELMTAKLREADAVAELKEVRQRVMELESQNQVCTNQIRRQDEEFQKFQIKIEDGLAREKELQNQLKEEKRKYTDLETKLKEEAIQARIHEAEHSQLVAEFKQKVAALESKNQELLTTGQLYSGDVPGDSQDLQEKIADLQMEVVRLRLQKKTSISSFGTEDEDDIMDMVMHKSTSSLVSQETPTSPLLTPTSPLTKPISPLAISKNQESISLNPLTSFISPLASPSQGPAPFSQ